MVIKRKDVYLQSVKEVTHRPGGFPDLIFFVMSIFSNIKIELSESVETKEYRLKYLFGAWVTKCVICAESDEEAIFDADEAMQNALAKDKLEYALVCGNRIVKRY